LSRELWKINGRWGQQVGYDVLTKGLHDLQDTPDSWREVLDSCRERALSRSSSLTNPLKSVLRRHGNATAGVPYSIMAIYLS
jgi:hypothetical protein